MTGPLKSRQLYVLVKKLFHTPESRELSLSLLAVIALLMFGTIGFSVIESWKPFDAFYMTVLTLSTVGFHEVHPLSQFGQMFAIVLIFMGVGTAMAVLPRIAGQILEKQVRWIFRRGDMHDVIAKMENHTIFVGYGRLCQIAIGHVRESDTNLVVVERNEAHAEMAEKAGFMVVRGDATRDEVLRTAGIDRALRLVSLLSKDADNLYVILTSRELNPELFIVSRAEDELGEKRLLRAGANRIISPYRVGGQKVANGLLRPYVTDFLDLTSSTKDGHVIEELKIPLDSPLLGRTLRETDIRLRTNVIVVALISAEGQMTVSPSGETILEAGATLIGLGSREDFARLGQMLFRDRAKS